MHAFQVQDMKLLQKRARMKEKFNHLRSNRVNNEYIVY